MFGYTVEGDLIGFSLYRERMAGRASERYCRFVHSVYGGFSQPISNHSDGRQNAPFPQAVSCCWQKSPIHNNKYRKLGSNTIAKSNRFTDQLFSDAFLKAKIKGTVAKETKAETTKTSPTKPAEKPKENAAAAKTGATVCASPAIAQATPNAPP